MNICSECCCIPCSCRPTRHWTIDHGDTFRRIADALERLGKVLEDYRGSVGVK